ncbi:GmrSD restriction endonuclease domain-containing protein [Fructobacillus tropaeoli]|uniref:GmrSD restriction endonuclease domain-containing protein n=1 Tax=Fructobacillus tropaeoli TaxID=709323 RepID=UPI0030C80D23
MGKDQNIWMQLLQTTSNPTMELKGLGNYSFFKRYKYIRDILLVDLSAEELYNFYLKKLNHIVLLVIKTSDLNDGYQIFSSFNSKGVPLTPLDLLKGIYFSKDGPESKWETLTDIFTDGDRADEKKMTRFVQNNFDAFESKFSSSLTKGNIVRTYDELFNKKGTNYIDQLIERAKVYQQIENDEDAYDYSLSGLAKLDSTTSYPLLLNILVKQEEYQISEAQKNEIIRTLINLFIRRNFVLKPKASNLRSSLNRLRIDISDQKLQGQELVDYVKKTIKEIAPDDEEFLSAIKSGIYDTNYQTTRFILISLERHFGGDWFNKNHPDNLDEYDGRHLRWTIEHIIPQGELPDTWVNDLANGNKEEAKNIQDENVHRLGNLTLTTYNPEMGQKSFQEKINYQEIDGNGEPVGIGKNLFLNQSIDKEANTFNVQSIDEREKILSQKLLEMIAF